MSTERRLWCCVQLEFLSRSVLFCFITFKHSPFCNSSFLVNNMGINLGSQSQPQTERRALIIAVKAITTQTSTVCGNMALWVCLATRRFTQACRTEEPVQKFYDPREERLLGDKKLICLPSASWHFGRHLWCKIVLFLHNRQQLGPFLVCLCVKDVHTQAWRE